MNIVERMKARVQVAASASVPSSTVSRPRDWLRDAGFNGGRSSSSVPHVSPAIAERHATVYGSCNVVSGDLAKVPLAVWQRNVDGTETRVVGHPLNYLLNVEASPGVPAIVARYSLNYAFLLRGNSVAYGPRDGGGELEMIDTLHQDKWQIYRAGRDRIYDFEDGAQIRRRVPSRSMIHLRNAAQDGWTGRSPIQVAADSMGLAIAGQNAAARNASGITTKAIIKLDDAYDNDEDRALHAQRIKQSLRDTQDDGIPVLGPDEDIKSLALSAADIELLSSRKFDREMIIGIYRVPPSKVQMLEHGVKANGQQQALDYRTDCLLHWGGFAEGQMALALFTEDERRKGLFVRHDYSVLLEPTTQELFGALFTATGGPFMKPDEARQRARLEGSVEGGDILYPPSNMTRKEEKKNDDAE